MHTVELLELALKTARSLGYEVRAEWLAGCGGACEVKGRKWLFLDLALTPAEQLEQVVEALRGESGQSKLPSALLTNRPRARMAA